MTSTGESLAATFEASNNELRDVVESLTDTQWQMPCAAEGWPVGVTAHHVAESLSILTGLVQAVANGVKLPAITMESLNQGNAEHAARATNVTRAETVELLSENVAAGAAVIRGLNDAQFLNTVTLPSGEMTVGQVVEVIMIGHAKTHIEGIRAAIS